MSQLPVKFYNRTLSPDTWDAIVQEACQAYNVTPGDIQQISVEPGYGRHVHDSQCGYKDGDNLSCMRNCEDSDLIVEIQYDGFHRAIYGIVDHKPVIWMD